MTKLSVNINKVATLRNARGGNNPDVIKVALDCEAFGAEGITVHPRPDERHIRRSDVYALRPAFKPIPKLRVTLTASTKGATAASGFRG
jgi:pyridoxine 5-phosphate synthase